MLIYIDHSIGVVLSQRKATVAETVFFSSLANMFCRGECYLCGSINSLDVLGDQLGALGNNVINTVKAHFAEAGSVINAVNTAIVLMYQEVFNENMLSETIRLCPNKHFVSVSTALSWSLHKKCCLIAENLEDCKFYELMASYYCLSHGIQGLRICLHHENGGGNTTDKVLSKCVSQDKVLTLCIVDSDRKWGESKDYPNPPPKGETCRRVIAESTALLCRIELPIHSVSVLDVHEIENLIPRQVMRIIESKQSPEMKKGLDMLNALVTINKGDAVLCYDYKNGLQYTNGDPQRAYWKEVLISLGGTESDMPPIKKSEACKDEIGECFFPPICCKALLQKAMAVIESIGVAQLQIDDYLVSQWERIGTLVFSWGCAGLPMYA
ncbi:MAG: hypothetical protein IKF99_14130 [Oscillospiraceae bacterium]|nr:hypothetical protein [Oscillospiraceae bacterium]